MQVLNIPQSQEGYYIKATEGKYIDHMTVM